MPPLNTPTNEYAYIYYLLQTHAGEESVVHIPVFTSGFSRPKSQLEMLREALWLSKPETEYAASFITQHLAGNPLNGKRLILVGSSAGGTVAIETLDILAERGIYVDQVVLRGSYVSEPILNNVGRVDYIAADPPWSDHYYSIDINPFDRVTVNEYRVAGFSGHVPRAEDLKKIGALIIDLISPP
jgi:hypothetical protein